MVATASLAPLHRACFPDDPWDASALAAILAMPGAFGRIAWVEDRLAGLLLARDIGGEGEILSLGVAPAQRRSGIGMGLLGAALIEARQRRLSAVALEVAETNNAARSLYARAGFLPVGRRRNYYRTVNGSVDALILRVCLVKEVSAT